MKNFDKWFADNTNSFYYNDSWIYGEAVWKAALEWILKEEYNYDREGKPIYDTIREELKNND